MKKLFLLSITCSLLFGACEQNSQGPQGVQGKQGPAGYSSPGTLTGHITLYNEYGDIQPEIASKSVRVILYNTSNAVVDSVNADSVGVYTITNIPEGDYTMAFRDSGYGQLLRIPFQLLGGGTIYADEKLSHIPNYTFTITKDSIKPLTNDTEVVIVFKVSAAPQNRNLALFVGNNSLVSSTPGSYSEVFTVGIPEGDTTFSYTVAVNSLYTNSYITPGSIAYFVAYPAAFYYASSSEYEDVVTGQTVYNALGSVGASANALKL
jgi:hypothetical protein